MNGKGKANALGLTIDIKKHRIRIFRSTFRALGNPENFRILVNPDSRNLILEACGQDDQGACRVTHIPESNISIEMYSRALIEEFAKCAGIEGCNSVKLLGSVNADGSAVAFQLKRTGERNVSGRK